MIKPDATSKGYTGSILAQILEAGFQIKAMKWTKLTTAQAGEFYAIHKERPFYGELVEFMSSGPIVAAILEKENLEKHNNTNMLKYFIMLDADHFVWEKQEYSDMIINEIKCML